MKLTRVKALVKKEFIQIRRDYRSLVMALAIPVLLLMLFGYALTWDLDNVPLAIWDQSNTHASRDLIHNFSASPYFKVVGYYDGYAALEEEIDKNQALVAMVIPRNFDQLLKANRTASVQAIFDGSDSNSASIALGYAQSIIFTANQKLVADAFARQGWSYAPPIEARPRVWFNEALKSKNFIIPGLIAVIMMVIATLLTSGTISREWERGTMEQLIATPMKSSELVLGKFIPYFIIGLVDVLIAVVMGQFLFHVPLRGSVVLLFVLSGIFLTGTLCWGLLISVVNKNQFMANQAAFFTTFLPSFLLSGFAFPISNMPKAIVLLSYIVPARYFVVILRGIYLKGIGMEVLWREVLLLSLFALAVIFAANKKFKKTIS